MTIAATKGQATSRAALFVSDYCHDALPFRTAELAAGWALEAYVKAWAHVPGSQVDPDRPFGEDVPRSLLVAEEALVALRLELTEEAGR